MTGAGDSILIPLPGGPRVLWGLDRRREPITTGIPLPRGLLSSVLALELIASDSTPLPLQTRVLDRWPDGSIRWLLLDFMADATDGLAHPVTLRVRARHGGNHREAPNDSTATGLRVRTVFNGVEVDTGRATFQFATGTRFPFSGVHLDGVDALVPTETGFQIAYDGQSVPFEISDVAVLDDGPLRTELGLKAIPAGGSHSIDVNVSGRVELFADSTTVRIEITLHNPNRAEHRHGQWPLGDRGSMLIEAAELIIAPVHDIVGARGAVELEQPCDPLDPPLMIHQESSGGQNWRSPAHCNAAGVVPLRFQGYRLEAGERSRTGLRASPIVVAETASGEIAAAVPEFWQQFPRRVAVTNRSLTIGFFPRGTDHHELQGGEQKSHRAVLAFGGDAVADPPLAWCHDPLQPHPSPDWYCATGVVPHLTPASADPHGEYLHLVNGAFGAEHGFLAKRERFDEYGWRHFGDLPADHESAFQPPDRPFISHYNNQYDAIAAFAMHFLRTGDVRWRRLMDELARHVRDIDIYHTRADKTAYNGGLFWHTYHYVDAGTSTHRTYPSGLAAGGGPSAEHNYTTGLMLHYFLTGERASQDAVIGLARWVIEMDDGRGTPFRWLAGGPTGLASATGSLDYHGPGRGAANSIVACLCAYRLTGNREFAAKAEELIRRCIHPADDLVERNLLDTERRWYYTVFLQALGMYLHEKAERSQFDEMFGYAQASLLHYARWVAVHEMPYLERREVLEHPTETWVAQDLRKADALWWASCHTSGEERERFLARARFFFDYAAETLGTLPTWHFTRPLVLVLSNGIRASGFTASVAPLHEPIRSASGEHPKQTPFVPQKIRALRRARWLAACVAAILIVCVWAAWALMEG